MFRVLTLPMVALIAAAALAQTGNDPKPAPETPPTSIPEVPAGDDPMNRDPDPAADSPAAKLMQEPAGGNGRPDCRVRRADTDTGFIVVCEERGDGG